MATAEEVERIAAIVAAARQEGVTVGEAMRRVRAEFPNMTHDEVIRIHKVRCEELNMDIFSAEAERKAITKLKAFMNRAAELTQKPGISLQEAIAFFRKRAQAGDAEANALLGSIDDPFLDHSFLREEDK